MKIKTIYNPPPIGIRSFDWAAYDDDTYSGEPNQPVGLGSTEQEAIDALYAATLMVEEYNEGLPH